MQRKIKLVLGLIICFLIVINGLQVTWIYNTYKQEKEQYGRVLTQSLGEAVMNYTYQQMQRSDNNSSTLFIISSPGLMYYNVTVEPGKEKMSFNAGKLFIDSIKSGLGHSQLLQIQNRKEFGLAVFDSLFKSSLRKSDISADYILDTIRIANAHPGKTLAKIQPLVPVKAFYPVQHPGFPVKTALMLANTYGDLYVYASFRPYSPFLYKKNILFIVTSLAILIIVNTTLLFVLKTIRRQKKINEIKNDFINNMTHELRTPITVSASAIDSILHHHGLDNKEKVREYLELSKAELLHLDHLVEKILNMSIEDRGNLELSYEKVNVNQLLSVIANNHLLVAAKNVRFHLTQADDGLEIEADRLHLANALNNIIDNAIKYSHSSVDIRISYMVQHNKLQIKIEDNGTGIAKEYRSEIFNDFFRVPQGNIHDIKGFGLGLSYVKKVIEKHNGSVKVESELNKGSLFTILLPLNQ